MPSQNLIYMGYLLHYQDCKLTIAISTVYLLLVETIQEGKLIQDKQRGWLLAIANFLSVSTQVLSLVTPKPTEVIRTSALRFPDVNRNADFLPRETKYDTKFSRCLKIISLNM